MSKIEKLSISGIRSFDHRGAMSIQFKAPLTLIVGMNGSGKTTIIECLKFATSGLLPPNSSSGSFFIHDPKMAGEKEVVAQIKISFTSADVMRMVSTRNMQLTVKKDKRTFKQLEGSIRMAKDGERNTISSRVGEMDTMMPRFLGVSKAVIDNVIFCHQEDSYWPMSAPRELKLKFDEIFEAHKYTRAVENIKVLQKNKRTELKTLELEEAHCKVDNDKAGNVYKKIMSLDAQCKELREQAEDFAERLREAQEGYEVASNKAAEVEIIVGQLQNKRTERQIKEENIKILRENLKEMSDSDQELQTMLEQYDERLKIHQADLDAQKKSYHDKETDVKIARSRQSTKEGEIGRFQAQKENYERQVETRNRLVQEAARRHDIHGYDLDIDNEKAKQFMQKITKKSRDQQAEFEQARAEEQEKVQAQRKILSRLAEDKSALKQRKENSRHMIGTYDRKISDIQTKRNNLNADEATKVSLENQLQDAQKKLQAAKSDLAEAPWNAQIDDADGQIRRLEDAKEKLEAELEVAVAQATESGQLDGKRKDLRECESSLKSMESAYDEKIKEVVGEGWKSQTLEDAYQRAVRDMKAHVENAKAQRDGKRTESTNSGAKATELRNKVKSSEEKAKAEEAVIKDLVDCQPRDYPEELARLEQARDDQKKDTETFQRVQEYLRAAVKIAKQHNSCKLCRRKFGDATEADHMISSAEKDLAGLEEQASAKELEDLEEALAAAKKASPHFDNWARLVKELPPMKAALKDEEVKHAMLSAELEDHDGIVRDKLAAERDVANLAQTVRKLVNTSETKIGLESTIEALVEKQKNSGLSRGIEAIRAEGKTVDGDLKAQKAIQTQATANRDKKKTSISSLELEVSNLNGQLNQAVYQLKESKGLDDQETEYKNLKSQEREKINEIDGNLQTNASHTTTEQTKFEDISRRAEDRDRDQQGRIAALSNSMNKLTASEQEITAYHDRGGDGQLERARRDKDAAEAEVNRALAEQQQIVKSIKKLEEQSTSYAETKRSIVDNLRYRRDLRQLGEVRTAIEELEKRNSEDDREKYQEEMRRCQKKRTELSAQQAGVIGELKGLDDQLRDNNAAWDSEYKHSKKKYRAAHVMVEITKAAIKDLGAYGGALDQAIMKYHTMKMEQINGIVDDLWRKTYQGTDVDTVMIRSESETVKANKSYNYRVVMVKQDTEMDMRGRCSAGQKVLASIIIRLALAECFGTACGVIALDEPTTNLDSENIRSLATSLSEIIKYRRTQSNFQLIVITHDEEFLRQMGCSDFTDTYYRVSRDDNQNSVIERQNIADVM